MLDFAHKTFLGIGAALALSVAAPAEAVTFGGSGWTAINGGPSCNPIGSGANAWAYIDVLAGASFNADFVDSDGPGNLCFNFHNTSLTSVVVTLASATVLQLGDIYGFLGGVQLYSEQATPDLLWSVNQGSSGTSDFSFTMAANSVIFFDWVYGDPYGSGNTGPDIDFGVFASPVPVPAGGLLLIGALGGLAALRRRKSV